MRSLTSAALWAVTCCLLWAAAILLFQVSGWLRFGEWQPVPAYALFVSKAGQAQILTYTGTPQPLNLVPALGADSWNGDSVAASIAGNMLGVRKALAWLLDASLAAWLLVLAMASLFLALAADG